MLPEIGIRARRSLLKLNRMELGYKDSAVRAHPRVPNANLTSRVCLSPAVSPGSPSRGSEYSPWAIVWVCGLVIQANVAARGLTTTLIGLVALGTSASYGLSILLANLAQCPAILL